MSLNTLENTHNLIAFLGTIVPSDEGHQVLDTLQVERERGITVKANTASMRWVDNSSTGTGSEYLLNLIDTPGHVDFHFEVGAHLCEGQNISASYFRFLAPLLRVKEHYLLLTLAKEFKRKPWPISTPLFRRV